MKEQGKRSALWTIRYTLLNAGYYSSFCALHAYAAVFLLSNGFNNTEVGILLAVANIISAVIQPLIAGIIDKQGFLTNRRYIVFSVLMILFGALLLLFVPGKKSLIFVIYTLIYMIQFAYQPFMTAICFEYQKVGCDIVYGLARGLGSASFAVTSIFIGRAVEERGVPILLWVTIGAMILSFVVIFTFKKPEGIVEASVESVKPTGVAHNSIRSFATTYPAFVLFLLGTICFFFSHNMINDFMIQIVRNLGGNETELGYASFIQAILELPVMALIGIVLKKITSAKLLVFSGAAFFVKIMILVFATGLSMLYLSQFFQLFAYAVFIPAGAYYVSSTMEDLDQVKGQAFITSAITIGGVFSNLISGVILDNAGVKTMLVTGSVVCALGVCITFIAMTRLSHHKAA